MYVAQAGLNKRGGGGSKGVEVKNPDSNIS